MNIIKSIVIPAAILCVVGLTGCSTIGSGIKVSDKQENDESFCGNPLVFTHKVGELQRALLDAKASGRTIDLAGALKVLRSELSPELRALVKKETGEDCQVDPNRPIHNIQSLERTAVRTFVFGPTAMSTSDEAKKMRELTDPLVVRMINFVSTRVYASLKLPLNIKYTDRGYNMRVTLVFENDAITGAFIDGSGDVNSSKSQLFVDPASVVGRILKKD